MFSIREETWPPSCVRKVRFRALALRHSESRCSGLSTVSLSGGIAFAFGRIEVTLKAKR